MARTLQRWRTAATALMPAVLLVAAWLAPGLRPQLAFLLAGTLVVAAGEGIRVWAAGHHQRGAGLIVAGPFAHTRNPLYWGSTVMGVGFCLLSQLWWSWLLLGGVLLAFYLPTVFREERSLAGEFGQAYAAYRAGVPRFAIRLSGYRPDNPDAKPPRFSWRNVLERDEHRTALWSALPVILFWLRLLAPGGAGGLL